jgi:hypothetical protein
MADPTPTQPSSLVDMQTSVAAAREELVASLVSLKSETTPAALAQRGLGAAKGWFTDEYGGIRPDRVAIVGAVVVGYVAIKLIGRKFR